MCQDQGEGSSHLFRDCVISSHVWKVSPLGISGENSQYIDVSNWAINFLQLFWKEDGGESTRAMMFVATLWAIWLHRNNIIFRGAERNPVSIIQMAKTFTAEGIEASRMRKNIYGNRRKVQNVKWLNSEISITLKGRHCHASHIVLVDGAWKRNKKNGKVTAAVGWVIKNGDRIINYGATRVYAMNPGQAEMQAVLHGLSKAKHMMLRNVVINTDSLEVIAALRTFPTCVMELVTICREIQILMEDFEFCNIK